MATFSRLVRFENPAGLVFYGEVPEEASPSTSLLGTTVDVYDGTTIWDLSFKPTHKQETVKRVLSPLSHVPSFVGVGLNYKRHATESGQPIPQYPVLFNKTSAALAGPEEDIPIHKEAKLMDYEGELCFIIGKDCKDLSDTDNPLDYILGYTVGNDVSSRWWQHPERSGQQAGYAKSFDKFAPIGPVICSTTQIPDPSKLVLTTTVNGDQRQTTGTDDLIFGIPELLRFLSVGHTLERGTVVMTGTPSGVAAFMQPPGWLQDGDVVEVEISGIGKIRNKFVFDK